MRKQALLLFLIFVVSCAPQTVTPMSVNTETSIAESTPTVTKTSTPPDVTTQPTPGLDVSSYRLKHWSQEDYQTAHDLAVDTPDFGLFPRINPNYLTAVQSERLLKFPDAKTKEDVTWELWLADQQGFIPEFQPGQDLLAMHLAEQLNAGESLRIIFAKLKNRNVVLLKDLPIQNLMGNGQTVHVLAIKLFTYPALTAVYAVFPQQDTYVVLKLQDWFISEFVGSGVQTDLFDVGDTNGNGLPELVIDDWTYWSGASTAIDESINHIEWIPENEEFSNYTFPVFFQYCDFGSCEGKWEFLQENAKKLLRTQSYWTTLEGCPDLTLQSTHQWDGEKYALIIEKEPIKPDEDISSECRFAWADTYIWRQYSNGWTSDLAVAIAEKGLQTWDSATSGGYGPAGKDYAKLRLGIWHDLRNENQQALTLLSSLAKSPSLPEYDFMSRLAGIYLETRNTRGKSEACKAIEDSYQMEFINKIPGSYIYSNDAATLKFWGIIEPKDTFCEYFEMVSSEISDSKISSFIMLEDWLSTKDIKVNQSVTADLNHDEKEDVYLALLERENEDGLELWSFSNASGKVEGDFLYWFEEKSPVDISRLPFVSSDGSVYYIFNVSEELSIFTISQNGDVEISFENYNVQSYKTGTDFLVITAREYYDCDIYYEERWDLETGETTRLLNPFEAVQLEIERKLFNDKDYSGTIDFIDAFLQSAPPEPKQVSSSGADGCTFYPPFFIPYYRYLRGLAYEQLGEDTQAVKAYYEIWKDYPDNFFGIISKLKLEPITP